MAECVRTACRTILPRACIVAPGGELSWKLGQDRKTKSSDAIRGLNWINCTVKVFIYDLLFQTVL